MEMISYCGLLCNECPAFIATQTNDDLMREKTAKKWSKMFGFDIKSEDVNCDGCQSGSDQLFGHCQTCAIRKCGMEKQMENCAHCDDYGCQTLESFIRYIPHARKKLEQIRADNLPG